MDLHLHCFENFRKGIFLLGDLENVYRSELQAVRKEKGCSVNTYFKRAFVRKNARQIFGDLYEKERQIIYELYSLEGQGYSIKDLSKFTSLSYSLVRSMMTFYQVEIRLGYNVITPRLKQKRSNIAKQNGINKTGWMSHEAQKNIRCHYEARGVQGYYFKQDTQKYVWLRSSYEYIYAKWLDKNRIVWEYELHSYKLKNGASYRPDFFIFENGELTKIVEIKGFWRDKAYKAIELQDMDKTIDISTIFDIKPYSETGQLGIDLKDWKKKLKQNEYDKNSTNQCCS